MRNNKSSVTGFDHTASYVKTAFINNAFYHSFNFKNITTPTVTATKTEPTATKILKPLLITTLPFKLYRLPLADAVFRSTAPETGQQNNHADFQIAKPHPKEYQPAEHSIFLFLQAADIRIRTHRF